MLFVDKETFVAKLLSTKLLVDTGLISYSAYLWHQPLFAFAKIRLADKVTAWLTLILVTLSFALAYITWRYVETPFRKRTLLDRKMVLRISTVLAIVFLTIGTYGHVSWGNFGRWSSVIVEFHKAKDKNGAYTYINRNKIKNKEFESGKIKILIIGDSNSGDLINVLMEDELSLSLDKFSLSSLTIRFGCGNLYLPKGEFVQFTEFCGPEGNDDLFSTSSHSLLSNADLVILASAWREREASLFGKSYGELVKAFGNKFVVFGSKQTTFRPIKSFWSSPNLSGPLFVAPTDRATNDKIRQAVGADFIDPYNLLCESDECLVLDQENRFIWYDGSHLTAFGAEVLSERMMPELKGFLNPEVR